MSKKTDFQEFIERKKKRAQILKKAGESSLSDIKENSLKLLKEPGLKNYMLLNRSIFNGATWVGKSTVRLLKPFEPTFSEKREYLRTERAQYLLNRVRNRQSISYKKATYNEIFKAIFHDFEVSHLDRSYRPISKVPKIENSVLLVSGVLNEIFTTPAFERGAKYIKDHYDINFDYCPTSGTKTTHENSVMIKNHMESLLKDHENVWVFAYSKGGIDFLHFLKEFGENLGSSVTGLSTVATPILGSERVNHKILKFINKVHQLDSNRFYRYLDGRFDLFFKDFQESLSSDFQENWFKENYPYLPRNMFYTALALESHWYESHVWMVLTKLFFQSQSINDGIVDAERALYPDYFHGINLGILSGHHLIGTRSSDYVQEALIEAHIVFLNYLGLLR